MQPCSKFEPGIFYYFYLSIPLFPKPPTTDLVFGQNFWLTAPRRRPAWGMGVEPIHLDPFGFFANYGAQGR